MRQRCARPTPEFLLIARRMWRKPRPILSCWRSENTLPKFELAVMLRYLMILPKVSRPFSTPSPSTDRQLKLWQRVLAADRQRLYSVSADAVDSSADSELPSFQHTLTQHLQIFLQQDNIGRGFRHIRRAINRNHAWCACCNTTAIPWVSLAMVSTMRQRCARPTPE
jgi:hypothetical protein